MKYTVAAARRGGRALPKNGSSALLRVLCALVGAIVVAGLAAPMASWSQSTSPLQNVRPVEQGARWADLKPAQRVALQPLENDWAGIETQQKQKWLELSARFPAMSPDERGRVQTRMAEWAKLTPRERGQARMRFQEAKSLPATDRQARWDAYQALPPEERQQLAARARALAAAPAAATGNSAAKVPTPPNRAAKPTREAPPQSKSNVVPNPAFAVSPVPITPTVVQARPGVTTTPISRRPTPPSHQQAGLPKIAATPGFVDKATLQPQRGPQGAATRPGNASPAVAGPATRP